MLTFFYKNHFVRQFFTENILYIYKGYWGQNMLNYGLQLYTPLIGNPFVNAANPFSTYYNPYYTYCNPFASSYNSFPSTSLFQMNNYGGFGLYQNYSNYNFLYNNSYTNPSTGYLSGGYGSLVSSGYNNSYNCGYSNPYNFLNSVQIQQPQLYQNNQSRSYYPNFNIYTPQLSTPTQQTPVQQPANQRRNNNSTDNITGRVIQKTGNGYGPAFLNKVKRIANSLNCNYRDLLAIMNSESGIRADAVNRSSNATGLIQFMPRTAQALGTTVEQLRRMSPIDQLDYVEKYLRTTKRQAGFANNAPLTGGQLYGLIFLPARAKREIFTSRGEAAYNCNRCLDSNNDGKITNTELSARIRSKYVSDRSFVA